VITVGLTGGIGSGKSEVARMLAERGAIVIDADELAREAVAVGTPGLAEVVKVFGPAVLRPDGSLDRARLGSMVFGDEHQLRALEEIVHPYVGRRSSELIAAAPEDAVVVYDVPLLVENDLRDAYDLVVVVDTDPQIALTRLVQQRGMTESGARARMLAQASRERRLEAADLVIPNDGSRDELGERVVELWAAVQSGQTGQCEQGEGF
jgi:dephospho-CoA kinase